MAKRIVRLYADANELIETHVDEIDEHAKQDINDMVHVAFMTAAHMLYAHHEGYVENAIESMCAALRRAVDVMDDPQFRQTH